MLSGSRGEFRWRGHSTTSSIYFSPRMLHCVTGYYVFTTVAVVITDFEVDEKFIFLMCSWWVGRVGVTKITASVRERIMLWGVE